MSYKSLSADYLIDTKVIIIKEPFVRKLYQIRNLIELLNLIIELEQ
ncbi:MAG: hypothetical protein LBV72_18890 [Tannerella sp.]|nr:hypothetical protein [Tannerella sp.]